MDILDKGCCRWSCQAEGKEEDLQKKDIQRVDVTELDAIDRVKWR